MAGYGKVLASQASPCPGLARQWPRLRVHGGRSGGQGLTRRPARTRGARDAGLRGDNRCGELLGRTDTRSAGSGYCRACGGGRGLLPQAGAARLARQPLGKPLMPDGPRRRWLPVQVTKDLSVQVTEGLAVPGPVPVSWSPAGATGRPVRWQLVLVVVHPRVALPRAAYLRRDSRGWRSRGCGPRGSTPRMASDPSLQGSALAPHHGARAREQDWGVP